MGFGKMDDGREDKLPWTRWFWADWEADVGLRSCGLASQGLWMRMLSIMARSKKKGYLLDGEKQMESKIIAKLTGESEVIINNLLEELISHGVPSITEDGTIYNRRMVREAHISNVRSEAGRLGGRPKKQNESKGKSKTKAHSASASASASVIKDKILTNLIVELILKNDPKAKAPKEGTPKFDKWCNQIRLCRERDERTETEIEQAIRFSQEDEFWKANILSTAKLREKIATLLLQSNRGSQGKYIGLSTKPKSPEDQKQSEAIIAKRRELETKYRTRLEEARKNKNQQAWDDTQSQINVEVAKFSRGLEATDE